MRCTKHETMIFWHICLICTCVVPMVSSTLEAKGSFIWKDSVCNATGGSHRVSVSEVLHPLKRDADGAIHTVQGKGNIRHAQTKWLELENVYATGKDCHANRTRVNQHFTFSETRNADGLKGTVSLKEGATLPAKPCDKYDITVAAYANVSVFTSCDEVPWGDGTYLLDPWGTGIPDNAFWTRCKNGFTEITQRIAKDFLNATLTWEGDVIEYGFLNDIRPYTVDGEGDHYAHYDIPIPFGYTQFYLDEFHIQSTSYLSTTPATSDIGDNGDGVYTQWNTAGINLNSWDGDFAFGSLAENGPVTSYGRFQSISSHDGIFKFEGNDVVFNVSSQSRTFRLHWGEGGGQREGWRWWNGSIWVRNTPVYTSCDNVPSDGTYFIDPTGERHLGNAFQTRCKDGFTEMTQRIAKDFLNATLTWEGDVQQHGFLNDVGPFTVDGGAISGHYAHYDIPIPFGYTQFYLEDFHIRSMGGNSEIRHWGPGVYTRWTQKRAGGKNQGDFAFGSAKENGPVTSYARFQTIWSHNRAHMFEGNGIVFNVSESTIFRLHWGEGGEEFEGWAWWNGTIWVRNTPVYTSCDDVPSDGTYFIDPSGEGHLDNAFRTQCKDGFTEITQRIAKDFLNATLTWEGDVVDYGFIDGIRPFTLDGEETGIEGSHFAHYDIPIPFGYTQFYLNDFFIRPTSYLSGGGWSEILVSGDDAYTRWNQSLVNRFDGDFAFGTPQERAPATSYARFQTVNSRGGFVIFKGNGIIYNVTESTVFRLHWGEGAISSQNEGWAWWNGSIWVRNTPVYTSCDNVPSDGTHFIDPSGNGQIDNAFRTQCKDGFMEITQRIAKDSLNATLTWEGDVIQSGFLDDTRPYTVDGDGAHYAHYDIPIPFGYRQFFLDNFRIRSTSYLGSHSSEIRNGFYTRWDRTGTRFIDGDFAFGSPAEDGPVTSYGRFQSIISHDGIFKFEGNCIIFNVSSKSTTFRLHWGEGGTQNEGWAWWDGSIWVRNTAVTTNSIPVKVVACTFELRVEPCPAHTVSDGTGFQCTPCLNGGIPNAPRNDCVPCAPYQVANETDTGCKPCSKGEIPNELQNNCVPCAPYQVANETNTLCESCLHGSVPADKRDSCVPCPMPRVANSTDTSCRLCAAGMVPHNLQTHCIPCPPGTFSRPGFRQCQSCGAFAVQPYWGQGDCQVTVTKAQSASRSVRVKRRRKVPR